jgi:hypothetical protein
MNDVTDIIYRSRDIVGRTAYRIPSCFSTHTLLPARWP